MVLIGKGKEYLNMSSVKSSHNHSFIQENLFVGLRIKMNKGFLPGDKKFNPF